MTSLSADGEHTCATSGTGDVLCWGRRLFGETGDGSIGGLVATPTTVALTGNATLVESGQFHTCAILEDRTVRCWGSSGNGELGDDSMDGEPCSDPLGSYDPSLCRTTPVHVAGLADIVSLAAGAGFTCALKADGTVWCWGRNDLGQIGDGTTTGQSCFSSVCRAAPVQVAGLTNAVEIAAGAAHACARIGDGSAWCWGFNMHGQLGNGASGGSNPTAEPVVSFGNGIVDISLGQHHTCAAKDDGTLWCVGSNVQGQLGDAGSIGSDMTSPIQVASLGTSVTGVGMGQSFGCAIVDGGEVRCWGFAGGGVLGNDATGPQPDPVVVALPGPAVAVGGGYFHACALLEDGHGICWGWNEYGQLGVGSAAAERVLPTAPSTTCP